MKIIKAQLYINKSSYEVVHQIAKIKAENLKK